MAHQEGSQKKYPKTHAHLFSFMLHFPKGLPSTVAPCCRNLAAKDRMATEGVLLVIYREYLFITSHVASVTSDVAPVAAATHGREAHRRNGA